MEPNTRLVIGGPQGTERTVALAEADITIGRGTTNDVVLSDAKASRVHAKLAYSDSQWTLIDLGSANGTLVNGLPVVGHVPLQPGDVIRVGESTLLFETGTAIASGPMTIDTPADLEAVSYTHLDVYKRQMGGTTRIAEVEPAVMAAASPMPAFSRRLKARS